MIGTVDIELLAGLLILGQALPGLFPLPDNKPPRGIVAQAIFGAILIILAVVRFSIVH